MPTDPHRVVLTGENPFIRLSPSDGADESCVASFFVTPDGLIAGRLRCNQAGILLNTLDDKSHFYDASAAWRNRCIRGVYHSGTLVRDRRSAVRTSL